VIFRTTALLVLLASCLRPAGAQTTANKGRQVIDQAIAALGGNRYLHMQNRVAAGRIYSFFHDQLSGLDLAKVYAEYLPSAPPNGIGMEEREMLGKKGDYSFLFLPDRGWDITFRGARPIPDETWERYVRTTRNDILYLLRERLGEPGLTFDYVGTDVFVSTHVEIVEITDAQDQTIRVYFDHNTMLPIRETYSWLDPKTGEHNDEEIDYDKWRDAGGVMWPLSIERQRNGYKAYQMFASHVDVDQSLPPGIFNLPANAPVLKKVN
jgi:hypothetical protein